MVLETVLKEQNNSAPNTNFKLKFPYFLEAIPSITEKYNSSLVCYWKITHPLYATIFNFSSLVCHCRQNTVTDLLKQHLYYNNTPTILSMLLLPYPLSMPEAEPAELSTKSCRPAP